MTEELVPWGEIRERTIRWNDPAPTTKAGLALAGIDYLKAMRDGKLPPPPISNLVDMAITEVSPGLVVFTCSPGEWGYNPIGSVHGGIMCTLLDSVCGCASQSLLPLGKGYTTVELKVNFLKGVSLASGKLTATGKVIKQGSRLGFTEGTVVDEKGDLVATASSTLLIFDLPT